MDKKAKTRRLKMTAWATFMLPLMAIGGSLAAKPLDYYQTEYETVSEEEFCCASGPSTLYTGYAANHAHYYEQPNFVYDYFYNLRENFPTNNCGNCGYTAAAMLLCYYDTYWNRHIIPDRFNSDPTEIKDIGDWYYSSPGVKDFAADIKFDENVKEPGEGATQQEIDAYNGYLLDEVYGPYLNEMLKKEHLQDNLMSYLYYLARGLYTNPQVQNPIWNFGTKYPTTKSDGRMISSLLNLYFDQLNLSSFVEAKLVHFTDFDNFPVPPTPIIQKLVLRNEAISRLREGQPIIYIGDLKTDSGYYDKNQTYHGGNGHMAIAYKYDEACHYTIGHIGWKGKEEYSKVCFEENFGDFSSYIYLDVKPSFEFTPQNERFLKDHCPVCACDLHSHIHADNEHRAAIYYGEPEYHALQCICGDTMYEMHEYSNDPIPYDSQNHKYECICGDAIYEMHEYGDPIPYDSQNHKLQCFCGDVRYERHNLTVDSANGLIHTVSCPCGYSHTAMHHYVQRGYNLYECSVCGWKTYQNPYYLIP